MAGTIIFTHCPKTAGTSLIKTIIDALGGEHAYVLSFNGTSVHYLNTTIMMLGDPAFMAGHVYYGVHRMFPLVERPRYITMLRDPVEWAVSLYEFSRSRPDTAGHSLARRCRSIRRWMRHPESPHNSQATFICGYYTTPSVELAIKRLEHDYTAWGIVERTGDSLRVMGDALGLNLIERHENGTPNRPALSPEVYDDLAAVAEREYPMDVALYRWARERFAGSANP